MRNKVIHSVDKMTHVYYLEDDVYNNYIYYIKFIRGFSEYLAIVFLCYINQ
jgi:hypothetical protein